MTTTLSTIDLSALDRSLAADIADEQSVDWAAFEAPAPNATVDNQRIQIVFSADHRRAGVVFAGSGSSGQTAWTDAATPEDALRRYLDDDMVN